MVQPLSKVFSHGMGRFFSGTMLSRVSGLGRDLMMAYCFGDHAAVAIFIMAFRFANLLRRFLGEGPLQSAFIPHFEELTQESREEADHFFQKLTLLLGGLVILLIAVGEGGISFFSRSSPALIHHLRWMLPSLLFISLYGLNVSFLQCHHRFFLSSLAPSLCNLCWIAGAYFLKNRPPDIAMASLAKWVLGGFVVQWGLTAFQMRRLLTIKRWLSPPHFPPQVKKLCKAFSLGVLGVGAVQLNALLDSLFAWAAHPSGPVYLWYAIRFQQLALALFGISALAPLNPMIARAVKGGETQRGKEIFSFGVKKILLIMIPMTVAIALFAKDAITLVLMRGSFHLEAAEITGRCLQAYGLGIIPSALIMLYGAAFYAQGNFKTPTLISFACVGISLALNALFIFGLRLGPVSTALATSIGAWANLLFLQVALKGWRIPKLLQEGGLIGVLTVFAAGGAALCPDFSAPLLQLLIPGGLFVSLMAGGVWLLRKRLFDHRPSKAPLPVVEDH